MSPIDLKNIIHPKQIFADDQDFYAIEHYQIERRLMSSGDKTCLVTFWLKAVESPLSKIEVIIS